MKISLNEHMNRLQLDDPSDKIREKMNTLNPIRHSSSIMQETIDRLNLALGVSQNSQLELLKQLQTTSFAGEMTTAASKAINPEWLNSIPPFMELSSPGLMGTFVALGNTDSYKTFGLESINEEFRKIHEQNLAHSNMVRSLALDHLDHNVPKPTQQILDTLSLHNQTDFLASITSSLPSEPSQNLLNNPFTAEPVLNKIGADLAQLHKKTLASIGINSLESLAYPTLSTSLGKSSWFAAITAQANATSQMLKGLENHYQLPLAFFDFAQNTLLAQMESLNQVDWRAFAVEYDFDSEEIKHHLQGMSISIQEQTTLQDITTTVLSHLNQLPPKTQEAVLAYVLIPFFQIIKWFILKSIESIPGGIVGSLIGMTLTVGLQQQPIITNSTSPQERSKHIQQTARDLVDAHELLTEFRFVIADELEVRLNPKSQSPTLGILSYGSPVQVVKRQGAFTLINWIDDSGESQLTGWVYSRYLQKFI